MTDLWPTLHTFRFESPWLLLLLLLLPLWAWLRGQIAPRAAVEYSSSQLLKAASQQTRFGPRRWLITMRYLALPMMILALARPQVEKDLSDDEAKGINIIMLLDFSGTMMTKDFTMDNHKVARLEALRKVVSEFLHQRKNDRVGVVRFDKEAFLVSPLTLDHDWLITRLAQEKGGHGTAPGSGLLIAAEHLLPATNQTKVIIIVTDADQVNQGPPPDKVAESIAPMGIKVHVVQIVDFKDMGGKRNRDNLWEQVAKTTGGQMFQVADYGGLRSVYRQIDLLEKSTFKEDKQKNYRELMAWFAIPAFILLVIELILRQTVWRRLP